MFQSIARFFDPLSVFPFFYFLELRACKKRGREGECTHGSIIHKFRLFQQEEVKETKQESGGESPAETAEVTTPTEASTPNTATSPDNKETKKKEKVRSMFPSPLSNPL